MAATDKIPTGFRNTSPGLPQATPGKWSPIQYLSQRDCETSFSSLRWLFGKMMCQGMRRSTIPQTRAEGHFKNRRYLPTRAEGHFKNGRCLPTRAEGHFKNWRCLPTRAEGHFKNWRYLPTRAEGHFENGRCLPTRVDALFPIGKHLPGCPDDPFLFFAGECVPATARKCRRQRRGWWLVSRICLCFQLL